MADEMMSGADTTDGMPAPPVSSGLRGAAKCRSASQTPVSPPISAASAMAKASSKAACSLSP